MSDPALLRRVWSDRQLRARLAADEANSGSPIVRKFPFAFDTPGLLTGHTVYTPTIGDILLDAWIEVVTAWSAGGGGAVGDFGTFLTTGEGYLLGVLGAGVGAPDMTVADVVDDQVWRGSNLLVQGPEHGNSPSSSLSGVIVQAGLGTRVRQLPAKFATADPIKVCVSQDGTITGADPRSSQGAAILYLVTATPV